MRKFPSTFIINFTLLNLLSIAVVVLSAPVHIPIQQAEVRGE